MWSIQHVKELIGVFLLSARTIMDVVSMDMSIIDSIHICIFIYFYIHTYVLQKYTHICDYICEHLEQCCYTFSLMYSSPQAQCPNASPVSSTSKAANNCCKCGFSSWAWKSNQVICSCNQVTLQLCTRLKEVIEKLKSYISLVDSISRKPGEGPTELGTLSFLNFCSCVTLSASKKSSPTSCSRKRRFSSCPFCRAESTKIPVRIFLGNERHRPPSTKLDSTCTPAKACVSRQAD